MKKLKFLKITFVLAIMFFAFKNAEAKNVNVTNYACPGTFVCVDYLDCSNNPVHNCGLGGVSYDDANTCGHTVTITITDCTSGLPYTITVFSGGIVSPGILNTGSATYHITYVPGSPSDAIEIR
jgi:hypothetical protein